jgi:YggT family protein
MQIAIITINTIVDFLTFLIFIYTLLSFFLDRYHPIQKALRLIIEPLLKPIRKIIPTARGIDFSPFILMILLQIIGMILVAILRSIS